MKKSTLALLLILLTGCSDATPTPMTVNLSNEFTLAPDQTVTLTDTELAVTLIGVTGDERCPSAIECALSGPVSLTISVQKDSQTPGEFALLTFTSHDGRSPDGQFEGIQSQVEYQGYVIQVKSVLPYPAKAFNEIKDSEYRVSFLVVEK